MLPVSLAPDVEQYVAGQLASGAFRSREELLTAAVRTFRNREEQAEKRAALVADLEAGLGSLDAGQGATTSAGAILAAVRADSAQ